MPQTLALIHTSAVFFSVESMIKQLLTEILPEVRLINIRDDKETNRKDNSNVARLC
jgi:hypothetical protein